MSTWTTAVDELRTQLSDGPTDRYHFRKRCLGQVDGVNTRFKTFEFRRVTDFTVTEGVYIDGVLQSTSAVTQESLSTGEFIAATAPQDGSIVEASYFTQWFIDSELVVFLVDAMRWLNSTDDYTTLGAGLRPCALQYACSQAYKKMAERWRTFRSADYKLEDAPRSEVDGKVASFTDMAKFYRTEALKMRDEFYKRQGRALQPLFGNVIGKVRNFP